MENISRSLRRGPAKAKGNQLWLMDRAGGEAYQFTELKGRLQVTSGRRIQSTWLW